MASVTLDMSRAEFEECVNQALDSIPDELAALVHNCVVLVDEEPPEDEPDLLGFYEGIPLTERDSAYGGELPDRIMIFRGPHLRHCQDVEELIDEIQITVVHEIAHYFGIDDQHLHDLGYA